MPSGPKKRKAAKKKKENEAHNSASSTNNNNNSNNPQGNDDPRSQDEKDSDGGEVGSPASQDQHTHRHPFNDENAESEKSDPSFGQSFADENKPKEGVTGHGEGTEKVGLEDNNTVVIEREVKSEKTFEGQNVSFGHIESAKGSHDGSERSSSSSSSGGSDDEARIIEKKTKEETYDPVLDTASYGNEHKHAASSSEEVAQNIESESLCEANFYSAVETASKVDLVTTVASVSEEVISAEEVEAVDNSGVSDVVVSILKEYEEQVLPISDEVVAVSLAVGDVVPKENENKVFPLLEENTEASSDVTGSVINGNDHKILTPSAAPTAETSNGSENIKDSKIPESSENKPLTASAPRVAERTSWFSCCGLFDVITGSSR